MRAISLTVLQQQISARKVLLGISDTPDEIEALRNKGKGRTAEKRLLLQRVEQRAHAAGLSPKVAYF